MDKIQTQASKVSNLVFAASTRETYQKTLSLTWNILKETGLLLWLVICLVFVGGEWFWKKSITLGRNTRNWYENLSAPKTEAPKSPTEVGQSLLSALGTSTQHLLFQAKQQLGIDAEPPAPSSMPTTPAPSVPASPAELAATSPKADTPSPADSDEG